MPYVEKTDAQLKAQINAIIANNENGEGLAGEKVQLQLWTVGEILRRAASKLNPASTDREVRELKMNLEHIAASCETLRSPDILERPADFEIAMADLANLKDLMLTRSYKKGTLFFRVIEEYGKDFVEGAQAYDREEFFDALKSIDSVLDVGLGSIDEEYRREATPAQREKFLAKRDVIALKKDPNIQAVAALLDTDLKSYEGIADCVFRQKDSDEGKMAAALYDLLERIRKTNDLTKKRELVIQAAEHYRRVVEYARDVDDNPNEFPLGYVGKLSTTAGKQFLNVVFDENNPNVTDLVKERRKPTDFTLPAGVSARDMAALFTYQGQLSSVQPGNGPEGLAVMPERILITVSYNALAREIHKNKLPKADFENLQNAQRKLADAIITLDSNANRQLGDPNKPVKASKAEENPCEILLGDTAKAVEKFIAEANGFLEKYQDKPEYVEAFRNAYGPLLTRWKRVDVEAARKYFRLPKEIQAEANAQAEVPKYEKPDYGTYSGILYMTTEDVWKKQNEVGKRIDASLVQADAKNKLTDQLKVYEIDAQTYGDANSPFNLMSERTEWVRQKGNISSIKKKLDSHKTGRQVSSSLAGEAVRMHNYGWKYASDKSNLQVGRKLHLGLYNMFHKHIKNSITRDPNPFHAYVAVNMASVSGYGGIHTLHKVVAAYMYMHEQYRANPNRTPQFKYDVVEKQAEALQKSPQWKAFFGLSKQDEKKLEEEYQRDLAVDAAILNTPAKKQERYELIKERLEKKVFENTAGRYSGNAGRMAELVGYMENPFSFEASMDAQRQALKSLKELGDTMTSCSFWSSKAYKQFYRLLKSLAVKDLDNMDQDEMGAILKDAYDKSVAFMTGRMAVRNTPARREHFEQTLDVLAILAKTGELASKMTNEMVYKVNVVRDSLHQDKATLLNRNIENTKFRQDNATVQQRSLNSEAFLKEEITKFTSGEKAPVSAANVTPKTALSKVPRKIKKTLLVDEEISALKEKLGKSFQADPENGDSDYKAAKECIPKVLALNIVRAYKDGQGRAVIDEDAYLKVVKKVEDSKAVDSLIEKYTLAANRKQLVGENNICKEVLNGYNISSNSLAQKMEQDEQGLQRDGYKLDANILKGKLIDRHIKKVTHDMLKKADYKIAESFDEIDRQLEEIDIANGYQPNEEILLEENEIDADDRDLINGKIVQNLKDGRHMQKVNAELKENGPVGPGMQKNGPEMGGPTLPNGPGQM